MVIDMLLSVVIFCLPDGDFIIIVTVLVGFVVIVVIIVIVILFR